MRVAIPANLFVGIVWGILVGPWWTGIVAFVLSFLVYSFACSHLLAHLDRKLKPAIASQYTALRLLGYSRIKSHSYPEAFSIILDYLETKSEQECSKVLEEAFGDDQFSIAALEGELSRRREEA
ncbi:MAG: hypothetical protein F4Z66_00630 [Gammaproteobacteria bacterium]|nr:hypothetical protein [Gammaproteobacteria bacterium]